MSCIQRCAKVSPKAEDRSLQKPKFKGTGRSSKSPRFAGPLVQPCHQRSPSVATSQPMSLVRLLNQPLYSSSGATLRRSWSRGAGRNSCFPTWTIDFGSQISLVLLLMSLCRFSEGGIPRSFSCARPEISKGLLQLLPTTSCSCNLAGFTCVCAWVCGWGWLETPWQIYADSNSWEARKPKKVCSRQRLHQKGKEH